MIRIDHEKSALEQKHAGIADAIFGVFSPFVLPERRGLQGVNIIPKNVTLIEVARITGKSPNAIKDALQHPVTFRSGKTDFRPNLHFTDTTGTKWLIRVGPPGKSRPKQAARKAGEVIFGAENRIRRAMHEYNRTVTTPVILERR